MAHFSRHTKTELANFFILGYNIPCNEERSQEQTGTGVTRRINPTALFPALRSQILGGRFLGDFAEVVKGQVADDQCKK
jgi:hypothetical protein